MVWVSGTRVQQCTLVRAAPASGEPKFGILIDSQGGVLSVDTPAWTLTPKVPIAAMLAPSAGSARHMTVEAVSATRANIRFAPESPLLDQLQRSDHFDLRVGTVTVRTATEDFNAAASFWTSASRRSAPSGGPRPTTKISPRAGRTCRPWRARR